MESCPCWLPSTLIIRAQVWDAVQFYSKGWSTPILMWLNLVLIFKSFVKSPVKLQCILHIMVMHINTIMLGFFSSLLTFCYLSLQSTLLTNHLGSSIVFPLPPQRGKVPDHGQRHSRVMIVMHTRSVCVRKLYKNKPSFTWTAGRR